MWHRPLTPAEVSVGRAAGGKVHCGTSCVLLLISTRAPFTESRERPLDAVVVWMKSIPNGLTYLTFPAGGAT